jgi:hypothetical protein
LLCALTGFAQMPAHYLEIRLPAGVAPEKFFGRYRLSGDDLGGWLQAAPGVNSYVIDTTVHGHPATGIKAILYAPGCAIQTLDLALSRSENAQYSFECQPVGRSSIAGTLIRPEQLYTQDVDVQARCVPRWAQAFLGLSDGMVTSIPVGGAVHLSAGGHFRLMIPDFSQDPRPGEIEIWVKEKTSDAPVAELVPINPRSLRAPMRGLRPQSEYPDEIVFASCLANQQGPHDSFGFARRPKVAERDGCE